MRRQRNAKGATVAKRTASRYEWTDDDGTHIAEVTREEDGTYKLQVDCEYRELSNEHARLLLKAFLDIATEFLGKG